MSRNRGQNDVQVDVHRGNSICLNKVTSKFTVSEIMAIAPVDTIAEARNAIDRHIAELNKGVRRKVLYLKGQDYFNAEDDEPRELVRGELTSWANIRGYRNRIEGVVMVNGNRDTISPDDLFEDTPENLAALKAIVEHDKARIAMSAEGRDMLEKIPRVELPNHLKKKESDE